MNFFILTICAYFLNLCHVQGVPSRFTDFMNACRTSSGKIPQECNSVLSPNGASRHRIQQYDVPNPVGSTSLIDETPAVSETTQDCDKIYTIFKIAGIHQPGVCKDALSSALEGRFPHFHVDNVNEWIGSVAPNMRPLFRSRYRSLSLTTLNEAVLQELKNLEQLENLELQNYDQELTLKKLFSEEYFPRNLKSLSVDEVPDTKLVSPTLSSLSVNRYTPQIIVMFPNLRKLFIGQQIENVDTGGINRPSQSHGAGSLEISASVKGFSQLQNLNDILDSIVVRKYQLTMEYDEKDFSGLSDNVRLRTGVIGVTTALKNNHQQQALKVLLQVGKIKTVDLQFAHTQDVVPLLNQVPISVETLLLPIFRETSRYPYYNENKYRIVQQLNLVMGADNSNSEFELTLSSSTDMIMSKVISLVPSTVKQLSVYLLFDITKSAILLSTPLPLTFAEYFRRFKGIFDLFSYMGYQNQNAQPLTNIDDNLKQVLRRIVTLSIVECDPFINSLIPYALSVRNLEMGHGCTHKQFTHILSNLETLSLTETNDEFPETINLKNLTITERSRALDLRKQLARVEKLSMRWSNDDYLQYVSPERLKTLKCRGNVENVQNLNHLNRLFRVSTFDIELSKMDQLKYILKMPGLVNLKINTSMDSMIDQNLFSFMGNLPQTVNNVELLVTGWFEYDDELLEKCRSMQDDIMRQVNPRFNLKVSCISE